MAGISDKRHSALDRTFSEDIQAQPDRPFRDLLGQHIIVTSVYLLSDSEAARWQELSRNIDDAFLEKFDTVISECKQSGQWKKFRDQVAQHIRESETKTILARQFSSGSPEDDDG
ncbi:hypothetical protein H0H93_016801 [Arthromyces matolae]|nr:hypothetical protein H0H93_016801 [Arthromyces matolae]